MDQPNSRKPRRVLSIFVLAMLNVSIMASLRNLPLVASYGLSALFFFAIVGIFFLLPSALISAELATGWTKGGGIYIWVREALGDRWGFFAVWMQWVHNIAWYPVILSFVASTFAYIFDPALADNKLYVVLVILGSFWGITLINYLGIQASSWFSAIGVIAGTIIPGIFIITLGVIWVSGGNPIHTRLSLDALLPNFSEIGNLVFLTGLFLAFMGLEVSSAHAASVKDPQKNYPRSIILAAIITFTIFMLGALAIAFVVPGEKLSLVSGLMEAFLQFFDYYKIAWIIPLVAFLLVIGAVAEVNAWIVGPVRGLYATCVHGNLPPLFQKVNKRGVPTNLLLFQGVVVSVSSLVILELPSVSAAFWILSASSAQIYLIAYILMFVSAIRLRYTRPHVPRAYKVPYRKKGIWVLALFGIISSAFGIVLSFFPPTQVAIGNIFFYEAFLLLSLLSMAAIPLIIYQFRQPHWVKELNHK